MAINRRQFLVATGAAVGAAATATVISRSSNALAQQWQPSPRYPDPLVKSVDPSFNKYRVTLAKVEKIAEGCRWAEGPVWFGDGRYLLWSDVPNNRILKWDEQTRKVSVFRKPSNNSNGNARDRQGRLITCEHDARRVTRTEYDGTITVIAESFQGKPLNSPNDIACKSDGSIWFSDPPFGILGFYEGHVAKPELPTNVYRWDPKSKELSVAAGDINRPNGLAFSPDESRLYVVESGAAPRVIRLYDVVENGTKLANPRTAVTAEDGGSADGLRVDVDGNLWCGWGLGEGLDGVAIFNPDGKRIGKIDLPERCANLCFGGVHRNRLFMCASTSVFSLFVNTQGAALV